MHHIDWLIGVKRSLYSWTEFHLIMVCSYYLFLHHSVMGRCMFLGINPFFLHYVNCWSIIGYSSLLQSFGFFVESVVKSLPSYLILFQSSFFLATLTKGLSILSLEKQLLVSLTFSIVLPVLYFIYLFWSVISFLLPNFGLVCSFSSLLAVKLGCLTDTFFC